MTEVVNIFSGFNPHFIYLCGNCDYDVAYIDFNS